MRRSIWSLIMISCTLTFTIMAFAGAQEKAVPAKIVQVQRGNVRRVIALSGTLTYADLDYVLAAVNGVVSQICAEADERIAAGEAIVRLESAEQQTVMAAYAAGQEYFSEFDNRFDDDLFQAETSVVRAESACTVRQILVKEGSVVTAGTPLVRLSSNEQEIVCLVNKVDVEGLEEGMWAWVYSDDDELGYAYVQSVKEAEIDPLTGIPVYEIILRPEKSITKSEGVLLDVEVYLAGCNDAATLPVEAITERGTVWWVDDYGMCTEISAGMIMSDEMLAWVSLPEGIKVAVGEFEEGQRVREAEQ